MTSQPEKVRVNLGDRSYDILVDSGLIASAGKTIRDAAGGRLGDAASVVYLTGMGALDLCAVAMISRRSIA